MILSKIPFVKLKKSINKIKATTWIIAFYLVVSISYLGIYFYKFSELSNNIDDYVSFATYLNGLGSIAAMATLIIIILQNKTLLQEKNKEMKKQNIFYLIDHFEINEIDLQIINSEGRINTNDDEIPTTYIQSEDYNRSMRSTFQKIKYIYESTLSVNEYSLMDIVKNVIINKIPSKIFVLIKEMYFDEDCIIWLRLDMIRWKMNISRKKNEEF